MKLLTLILLLFVSSFAYADKYFFQNCEYNYENMGYEWTSSYNSSLIFIPIVAIIGFIYEESGLSKKFGVGWIVVLSLAITFGTIHLIEPNSPVGPCNPTAQ